MFDMNRRESNKIQVSTKYRRGSEDTRGKRIFNLVIKTVMMSMVLLSSFISTGILDAKTASASMSDPSGINIEQGYQDETALVLNLKSANSLLSAAIEKNQLDEVFYNRLMRALTAIDVKLGFGDTLSDESNLKNVLAKTDALLKQDVSSQADSIKKAHGTAVSSYDSLASKLGLNDVVTYELEAPEAKVLGEVAATVPQALAPEKYKDYKAGQWWSEDFKWGINKGIISGYINAKHPSQPKLGWGNWIDPTGDLTEYQMLSVMLRYLDAQEIENKKVQYANERKKHIAYPEYVMASEYKITTKGTKDNANFTHVQVTRGQMAQAIVSMHYGKPVSQNDAIKFMYDNNLTMGKNANGGKTVANFGAYDRLERNQIITFMHRYEKMMTSTKVKDTLGLGSPSEKMLSKFPNQKPTTPTPPPVVEKPGTDNGDTGGTTPPPTTNNGKVGTSKADMSGKTYKDVEQYLKNSINEVKKPVMSTDKKYTSKKGIKTVHPNATYNVNNQAEYDAVIAEVKKRIDGMSLSNVNKRLNDLMTYELEYTAKALTGEYKPITDRNNPQGRTPENVTAINAISAYKVAYDKGVSLETIIDFQVSSTYIGAIVNETNIVSGPPETAYDYFIKNEIDCTSVAYAYSVMYSNMGYQTAVIHSPNALHAFVIILLDGQWFNVESGVLKPYDTNYYLQNDYITEKPVQGFDKLNFVDVR